MEFAIWVLLGKAVVAAALIIILLLLLIWILLRRKKVEVPTLTVKVDKTKYLHGETVEITGTLEENGEPVEGETITLKVKDSAETETALPDVVTESDGTFAASFTVPSEMAPGSVILTATGLGISAQATFTLNEKRSK